jgi:hypothetical protein
MTNLPKIFFNSLVLSRDRILHRLSNVNPEESFIFSQYYEKYKDLAGNLSFGILFAAMANSINGN